MRQTASKPARAERGHPGGRPQGAQWRSAGREGLFPARAATPIRVLGPPRSSTAGCSHTLLPDGSRVGSTGLETERPASALGAAGSSREGNEA